MAKEFSKAFYNSKEWQACRAAYIASVHNLCEKCMSKGIVKPGKIVHHKVLLTPNNINNPFISLNWDLLEFQCQDCHNQEHHGSSGEVIREGLTFNSKGDLVELVPPIK